MNLLTRTLATTVLVLAFIQTSALAQQTGNTETSFEDLLDKLQTDKDEKRDPSPSRPTLAGLPDMPTAPTPNTAPVYPKPVDANKPLPWTGLKASPAFQKTSAGVKHPLSGFVCNDDVGDFELSNLEQVNSLGDYVSCGYKNAAGKPALSVVLYTGPGKATSAEQLTNLRTARLGRNPGLRELSSNRSTVSIGRKQIQCENTTLGTSKQNGAADKKTFSICELGRWRMLFSLGQDVHKNANTPEDFVKQFVASQLPAARRTDQCNTFVDRLRNEKPSGATGISYHADGFNYTARGDGCYAGHTSDETGSIVIRYWPNNPDTPMTADYVSVDGQFQTKPTFRIQDMWASVPTEDRGPAGYLLMREQADGTITVYSGYTRIPSDARFYEDAGKAFAGKTEPTMLAKQNDGGGWTMAAQ